MAERRASPFILYQQWFRYCAGAKRMNDMAKQPWISTFASRVKEPLEDIPARLAEDATRLRNAVQPLLRAKPRKLSPAAMSALAIGALAIGALAIGFVAIGGMSVGRARNRAAAGGQSYFAAQAPLPRPRSRRRHLALAGSTIAEALRPAMVLCDRLVRMRELDPEPWADHWEARLNGE